MGEFLTSSLSKFILFFLILPPVFLQAAPLDSEIIKDCFWSELASLPKGKRPPVGLALSGGGARAFAHVGVIEALSDSGFPVDYISGTSMGAVIGGLYSLGFDSENIWRLGSEIENLKISRDFSRLRILGLLFREKMIDPIYIRKFVDSAFGDKLFSDLKIPFACVAMDIRTGEKVVFSKGEVAPGIKASVNLPGIFSPFEYKHRYLVDGGVVDFLPVDAVKDLGAAWVISSVAENSVNETPSNVLSTLMQVIDIRGSLLSQKSKEESDFLIYPDVKNIQVAEFDKCIEAGERGLRESHEKLPELKEKYILDSLPWLLGAR